MQKFLEYLHSKTQLPPSAIAGKPKDLSFIEQNMRHRIVLTKSSGDIAKDFSSHFLEKGTIEKGIGEIITSKKSKLLQQVGQEL